MKVLPAINQQAAIYIHGNSGKPVVIMPPAPGKAPIPVEINEKDERVMKYINQYLEDGKIRKFTGETESAIDDAKAMVARLEGELEKAQDAAIKAKTNHDEKVIRLNNDNETIQATENPNKTLQNKVAASQKAYDKADEALGIANDNLTRLTDELETANEQLEELSE